MLGGGMLMLPGPGGYGQQPAALMDAFDLLEMMVSEKDDAST